MKYLDSVDESLRVRLELPFTFLQLIRAGGDHTSGANGCLGDISVTLLVKTIQVRIWMIFLPACNRKEIARNRNPLVESVKAVP